MIPKAWIFIAFCFAAYAEGSQVENAECDLAVSAYAELVDSMNRGLMNFTHDLQLLKVPDGNVVHDPTKVQGAVDDLCEKFNTSAQVVENVISRCPHTSYQCIRYKPLPLTPDLIRALAKLCKSIQASEYVPYIRTLASCQASLISHWNTHSTRQADHRFNQYLTDEVRGAQENSTVSCGFGCGRKCACRAVQTQVQVLIDQPDRRIREVCGQNEHDLLLMLQERLLNALHCSEFGDYVVDWSRLEPNHKVG